MKRVYNIKPTFGLFVLYWHDIHGLWSRSKKYPPKFGKIRSDIKWQKLALKTMMAKHCYLEHTYKNWNSYIVLYSNNTWFLRRYSMFLGAHYFLLCCLFPCGVCFEMLTCLFCILFEFFSKDQNYKKYNQLELLILLSPTKNYPNLRRTHHATSDSYTPFLSYFSLFWFSLPYFYPVPPFIGFRGATGTVFYGWVDRIYWYTHQLTTCYILARRYALASW